MSRHTPTPEQRAEMQAEAIELRRKVGLNTRDMARFALLLDETGWSKVEGGRTGIDPARLLLVRAKVAVHTGDHDQALALLKSD